MTLFTVKLYASKVFEARELSSRSVDCDSKFAKFPKPGKVRAERPERPVVGRRWFGSARPQRLRVELTLIFCRRHQASLASSAPHSTTGVQRTTITRLGETHPYSHPPLSTQLSPTSSWVTSLTWATCPLQLRTITLSQRHL